jgi:hypothetical protein
MNFDIKASQKYRLHQIELFTIDPPTFFGSNTMFDDEGDMISDYCDDVDITRSDRSWLEKEIEHNNFESLLLPSSQAAPSTVEPSAPVDLPMTSLTAEELVDLLGDFELTNETAANDGQELEVSRDVFQDLEPIPVLNDRQQMISEDDRTSTFTIPNALYPLQDKVTPLANAANAVDYPFLQNDNSLKTYASLNCSSIRGSFEIPTFASPSQDVEASGASLSTIEEGSSSEDESIGTKNSSGKSTSDYKPRFRHYQCDQWHERYTELCKFHEDHGHSSVPHTDSPYKRLARWVKRQRYQYKLRQEGKPSAMTDDRIKLLEKLGFVWDSHGAAWEDRLKELEEFKAIHKHCNVPSNYKANSSLASWIKCQRRQYRLYREGKQSNITQARIDQLEAMGFSFNPRVGYHHQRLLLGGKGWS